MNRYAILLLSASTAFATIDGDRPDLIDNIKPHRMTYEHDWSDLNPSHFLYEIAQAENGIRKGWHKVSGLWFPHESPEGGNDTIAYGHKLTNAEVANGTYECGITERQAWQLLIADIEKSLKRIKIDPMTWNSLSWKQKWLLLDFQFNLGDVVRKFPKFTKAVMENNKQEMLNQYKRYYKDASGVLREVKDRNTRTRNFINENF